MSNAPPAMPASPMGTITVLTPQLGRVLVADDEIELMNALVDALTAQGYQAAGVTSGQAALEALRTGDFDLLLSDLMMPGMNGIELLKASLAFDPHLVGVIMTGQGTLPTAVEAMKTGAFDYLLKPFRLAATLPVLARAMEVRRLRLENIQLRDTVAIYNLSQVIAFSLDSRVIMEQTLDAAAQQVDADEVSLMLVTPAGDELYVAAVRGDGRDALLHQRIPLEQGIAGWVARQGEPLILNGEIRDARFAPVWPRADIRSAISLPLLSAGKLVGVLNVNYLRQRRPFTLGQVKALSILTATGASALHSAALYEESQRLRSFNLGIVETMAEGLTLEDAHGRISYANPRLLALVGYTADELIGQPWHTLVPRREHARVAELSAQNSAGQASTYESILLAKDGREIPVLVSATQFVHGGQSAAVLATFADLTERKRAEAALAQTNDLLSRAEQMGRMGSWSRDTVAGRVAWSDGLYRIFGLEPQECAATYEGYLERLHPDDRERVRLTIEAAYRQHGTYRFESRIVLPDGQIRFLESRGEVLLDVDRKAIRLVGIVIDITERKLAEQAVAASDAELRAMFAAMTDVVLVLDANGRFLKIAPTNPSRLVKPPDELVGRTLHEVFPAAEADNLLNHVRLALQQTEPIHFEYHVTINGVQMWFDGTATAMGPDKVFWIGRDISERIQRRHELEAIAAVSTALRTALTRTEIVPVVLDEVVRLSDASSASLWLADPITAELIVELGRGEMADLAGRRLAAGAGISGRVIATGQPYVTDDAAADPLYIQIRPSSPDQAVACLPLITQGQVFGVLWAARARPFAPEDVRVLTAIADIAGSALQRAGLYEQTDQRLQRLAALRAIDVAISSSLDLRVTLNVLLDQVIAQLHADAAAVLLLNPHTHALEYSAGRGLRNKFVDHFGLRLGQGYAGRVALERRLLALPDLAAEAPDPSRDLLAGEGIRAYHGAPLLAKGLVLGVLEVFHHAPLAADADWLDFLEALAGQAAIAIDNTQLFDDLQRSNVDLSLAYDATIEGWSRALDLRDKETEGHSRRVTQWTVELSSALGIGPEELVHIRRGALLHDIGKMGVPDSILLKPGPLTGDEWLVMRQHPVHAYNMLVPIRHLQKALDIPYCHHEKWDGSGYPRGLRGQAIPFAARIFAVVDVWDALSSNRPYRAAWPQDKVLDYIRAQSGQHFDPDVVAAFLRMDRPPALS